MSRRTSLRFQVKTDKSEVMSQVTSHVKTDKSQVDTQVHTYKMCHNAEIKPSEAEISRVSRFGQISFIKQ